MSGSRREDTIPLLWPQQSNFPGAGAFPAAGRFPGVQSGSQMANNTYRYFQGSGYGGIPSRPVTPPQTNKKIVHDGDLGKDPHSQFCALTGCPPTNAPAEFKYRLNVKTLYGRAVEQVKSQNFTYQLTAALTNTLLLLQIVLGAALTGLGGAGVPPYVITLFGAANTIIAGLVAYLKSRGQPMRARMFRDEIERVVDEIENSEVMWLGIAKDCHGYSDIDTEGEVTVRSEVARLTRLLDRAIRNNTANNPDLYSSGGGSNDSGSAGGGLANRPNPYMNFAALGNVPMEQAQQGAQGDGAAAAASKPADEDASPATAVKKKDDEATKKKKEEEEKKKAAESSSKSETKTEGQDGLSKTISTFTSSITSSGSGDKGKGAESNQPGLSVLPKLGSGDIKG